MAQKPHLDARIAPLALTVPGLNSSGPDPWQTLRDGRFAPAPSPSSS